MGSGWAGSRVSYVTPFPDVQVESQGYSPMEVRNGYIPGVLASVRLS